MTYTHRPAHGEWDQIRELEARLDSGAALPEGPATLSLIRTAAGQVGFSEQETSERFNVSAEQLVRMIRERIREGSRRLSRTMIESNTLVDAGEREAAKELFRRILQDEPVPFYRELAENELRTLDDDNAN